MKIGKFKTLYTLSILVIILMVFASVGGILLNDLYRDNAFVTLVWKTTDLVTLFVPVPIFAVALFFSRRGSMRGLLVLLAMVDYSFYNYAYYLFGAAFNWFFLVYIAIVVLSAAALIAGLIKIDADKIKQQFRKNAPIRWVSGYMLFVAAGLTTVYLMMIFGFIFSGQPPAIIEKTGHVTNVVFALDLSLVVPVLFLGAIWFWKKRPWGYVLAGISVLKGAVYTFVLAVVTIRASIAGVPDSASEIPLWSLLTVAGITASTILLANLKNSAE